MPWPRQTQCSPTLWRLSALPWLVLISLAACSPGAAPSLRSVTEQLIVPWHQALEQATGQFQARAERLCENPANPGEYRETQAAWRQAMLAWERVNLITFGPISENPSATQLQFSSDQHNLVGKKITQLLASPDPITPASLAQAGAATQGLSAAEYLLFDAAFSDPNLLNGKPCELLRTIGKNSHQLAQNLSRAWTGPFGQGFANGHGQPPAGVAQLIHSLVQSGTILQKEKIEAAIGCTSAPCLNASEAKPFYSEFWRSQSGKDALITQLQGLLDLFDLGVMPFLDPAQQTNTAKMLRAPLVTSLENLQQGSASLLDLINTASGRNQLAELARQLDALNQHLPKLLWQENTQPLDPPL
jgi:uncharacterized protein